MNKYRRSPIFILLGLLFSGCSTTSSPTFLNPNSTVASNEAVLFQIILFMALGVFLLVEILLVYNIIRFRRRPGSTGEPKQKFGNWRLEFFWTGIPMLLVLILFVLTIQIMTANAMPEDKPTDIQVHVIGHQWWWEFDYPDLGIVTANELHVPVTANVRLTLNSVDVIHSFWVPQLSGKMDVIPGQTNQLWFRAQQPGDFIGQCSEFCGLNHANMRIKVVAETADQFSAWVQAQQQQPAAPTTEIQQKAFQLLTTGACAACHSFGDHQLDNPIGPNLTHLMSRSVFAGAVFDLTPENLRSWLSNTQAMKPGNDMKITVTSSEMEALMAYLPLLK